MIIQIGHSRHSEYINELYNPIKSSLFFHEHTWIFPHDGVKVDSRETLRGVDVFLAEMSHPATGLGIELGFAALYEKKILCIYKKGSKIGASLTRLTEDFIEYENEDDMVEKISNYLKSL